MPRAARSLLSLATMPDGERAGAAAGSSRQVEQASAKTHRLRRRGDTGRPYASQPTGAMLRTDVRNSPGPHEREPGEGAERQFLAAELGLQPPDLAAALGRVVGRVAARRGVVD